MSGEEEIPEHSVISRTELLDAPQDVFDFEMQRFFASVKLLGDVLDYETENLVQNKNLDFSDVNARKVRGIRLLSQSMENLSKTLDADRKHVIEQQLQALLVKLKRNSQLLEIHLQAVSELAEIMQLAEETYETDGTYSPFSVDQGISR